MPDDEKDPLQLDKYVDHFADEMALILGELEALQKDADDISDEIEEKKKAAKQNRSRHGGANPLTYLYNMYANLSSVRGNRIALMTLLVNVKRLIADLTLKDAKAEKDVSAFAGLAAELYARIAGDRESAPALPPGGTPDELDEILGERGESAFREMTEDPAGESEGSYVCTTEGEILLVDEDYEVVREVSGKELADFRVVRAKGGVVKKALWISGNAELELVEADEGEEAEE